MLAKNCKLIKTPPVNTFFFGGKSGKFFVLRNQDFSCLYEVVENQIHLDTEFQHPAGRIPLTNEEVIKILIVNSSKEFNANSAYFKERSGILEFFIGGNLGIEKNTILVEKRSGNRFFLDQFSDQTYYLREISNDYSISAPPDEISIKDNILTISWNQLSFEITKEKYENSSKTPE